MSGSLWERLGEFLNHPIREDPWVLLLLFGSIAVLLALYGAWPRRRRR